MTLAELSAALNARGLTTADPLPIAADLEESGSPWYVRVVMGVSAWFAGLLLLVFIMLSLERVIFRAGHEQWAPLLFIGAGACGLAAFLFRAGKKTGAFAEQFALAMSCAGQAGIAFAIGEVWSPRAALWGMVVVEIVLVYVMHNRLHRMLSSATAVLAWALATHELLFHEIPGVSWFTVHQGAYQSSVQSVVLWMAVWGPVAFATYRLAAGEARWMAEGQEALLRPVMEGLIAALAITPLASHPASFWMALGMGAPSNLTDGSTNATALWPLLAIGLSLLALALAFELRNRPLMGVAIIFSLLEVSSFYYILGTTLLVKSVLMLALGAGLLAAASVLAKEPK